MLFESIYDVLIQYLFGSAITVYPHLELIVTLVAALICVAYALLPLMVVCWIIKSLVS